MSQGQQEFPSNLKNQDLYSQIAASDIQQNAQKPKRSFVMKLMVDVMRFTLFWDEKRRRYQKFFNILSRTWASFMVLLYTSSVVMLGVFVYSYIQFPNLIQNYFSRNGVLFKKMEIPGYIVSSVKLKGLHDKNNTFWIDTLTVSSNFGDFLQGRVKSVILSGVRFELGKEDHSAVSNTILPLVMHLNDESKTNLNIRVDSLEIKDAVVTLKGRDFELPVHFSLTGIYGSETNMSAYLTVDKPALSFQGPLVVRGDKSGTTFSLDIHTGHVRIPGRPPENLTGQMSLKALNDGVQSFQGQINLLQSRQEKVAKLDFTRDNADSFKGNLNLSWLNITEQNAREEAVNVSLDMTGLEFKKGLITTNKPISLALRAKKSNFKIGRLNTQLKGKLNCLLLEKCSYQLDESARVTLNNLTFPLQSDLIKVSRESTVLVQSSPNLFSFPFREGKISFEAKIGNVSFNGRTEGNNSPITFRSGSGHARGEWNLVSNLVQSVLDIGRINYQTSDYKFSDAQLTIDNVFSSQKSVKIKSPRVSLLNNPLFKKVFSLDYETKNGTDRVAISFPKERVRLLMNGYINPATGYINAQVSLPPVSLENIGNPPSNFSEIFPKSIQKISGQVAAEGRLVGSFKNGIQGPFDLGFENVSVKTDQMVIDGLNASLQIQTLKPFVTASKQPVFVKRITTAIPFDNISAIFKIDNQFLRIDELSTLVAGVPFQLDPAIVPYKDINTLLYLRQKGTDISMVSNGLKIPDWHLKSPFKGRTSLVMSVKDRQLMIERANVQIDRGELVYNGKNSDKPKGLGADSGVRIQSGSIVLEQDKENEKNVALNLNLDTVLPSTKKHWLIQTAKTMQVLPFFVDSTEVLPVPNNISSAVQSVFQRSKKAMK